MIVRTSCDDCGAYCEQSRSDSDADWASRKAVFDRLHGHSPVAPVVLKLGTKERDSFSSVLTAHDLILHQATPVTDGSVAFFVSKPNKTFEQSVRIFASNPAQLEARLPSELK